MSNQNKLPPSLDHLLLPGCTAQHCGPRNAGFDLAKASHEIARRIQWAYDALDKHNDPDEARAFLVAADALLGQALRDCEMFEEGVLLAHAESIATLWVAAEKLEEEQEARQCPECKGRGQVSDGVLHNPSFRECPACDGRGTR